MVANRTHDVARLMAEASNHLFEAWSQPWLVFSNWNAYWGEQCSRWLAMIASAPTAWLPALADERTGQPAPIDFFLPWLPRGGASAETRPEIGDAGAVRAMIRASAPHVGHAPQPAKVRGRRKKTVD